MAAFFIAPNVDEIDVKHTPFSETPKSTCPRKIYFPMKKLISANDSNCVFINFLCVFFLLNSQKMRKGVFIIIALFLLTACGKQTQKETEMDFRDNVKEAFADSGRIDLSSLQWTREPKGYEDNRMCMESPRWPAA